MTDREEETKSGDSPPPPLSPFEEGPAITMNLFLQEAVYALMAEANLPKHHTNETGESSRNTLPPVQDSALKGPFDDVVGVEGSPEDEKPRNEEEQTPRIEQVEDIREDNQKRQKLRSESEDDSHENEDKKKEDDQERRQEQAAEDENDGVDGSEEDEKSKREDQTPRKEKAHPFDLTGGVDDSEENEENQKEDQRPRSESEQDSWENKIEKEVDEPRTEPKETDVDGDSQENTEEEIEDHRPRSESEQGRLGNEVFEPRTEPEEADAFALMLLSGVAREIGFWKNLNSPGSSVNRPPFNPADESQENVESNEEDQKLRCEIANWYAEKIHNEFNKEMSSLSDVMKEFESYKMQKQDGRRQVEGTSVFVDENELLESDYADKILGIVDNVDSHVVEEKTEKRPMNDSNEPWTYLDTEIAILESIVDYKAKKGRYPFTDDTDLADFIKNWLHIDVHVGEFSDLIQFLRHKYAKRAGKMPVNVDTPKTKEEKVLKLALGIWG